MEVKIQNDQSEKIEKFPIEQIENNVFNLSTTSILLNNPLDFLMIKTPLEELSESQSAIIHIKNSCKNSICNCYVNCCFGHSVTFNTFLNTPKGTKYLFKALLQLFQILILVFLKII